ncbi:MAG: hypothetical protein JWP39_1947 [Jatrophihabitans sp.]|jgi:acyl carrier protein|nr:hypothetical protein [Jatrophihabitans sp.]
MDTNEPDAQVIDKELVSCFQSVFPFLSDGEIRVLRKDDFAEWDSLASLSLVTVIEEEFRIRLDDDAVLGLESYAAARAVVEQKTAKSR